MTVNDALETIEKIVPNDSREAIDALIFLRGFCSKATQNLSAEGHPMPVNV